MEEIPVIPTWRSNILKSAMQDRGLVSWMAEASDALHAYSLELVPAAEASGTFPEGKERIFKIFDTENGLRYGFIHIAPSVLPSKGRPAAPGTWYVQYVVLRGGKASTGEVRGLMTKLKSLVPGLTTLKGHRISGAKVRNNPSAQSVGTSEGRWPLQWVKLSEVADRLHAFTLYRKMPDNPTLSSEQGLELLAALESRLTKNEISPRRAEIILNRILASTIEPITDISYWNLPAQLSAARLHARFSTLLSRINTIIDNAKRGFSEAFSKIPNRLSKFSFADRIVTKWQTGLEATRTAWATGALDKFSAKRRLDTIMEQVNDAAMRGDISSDAWEMLTNTYGKAQEALLRSDDAQIRDSLSNFTSPMLHRHDRNHDRNTHNYAEASDRLYGFMRRA